MAINYFPTSILCSSYSKAILAGGVADTTELRPGMLVEVSGKIPDGTIKYRGVLITAGPATCCVVLENLAMGRSVGGSGLSTEERITVAYIPPGEIFYGLAVGDQTITIGEHLEGASGGYFRRYITLGYPNAVVAVAMETMAIPAGDYAYVKMIAF